jgi:hypothetical protein
MAVRRLYFFPREEGEKGERKKKVAPLDAISNASL